MTFKGRFRMGRMVLLTLVLKFRLVPIGGGKSLRSSGLSPAIPVGKVDKEGCVRSWFSANQWMT
eukprot:CAMPEP_0170087680 /NCGR_PEP_ID=MMETSP0019_2-20121128/22112_1 /TAXON_ID=98059 /ORGANISM="Dinobryon sp., Strain UTEXLB2267" /LENGTH=63 /DNA_ID=CAMNT_0010305481 /DNA_START=190 /DNA_END=381 /DNA_ORIENTATION=-